MAAVLAKWNREDDQEARAANEVEQQTTRQAKHEADEPTGAWLIILVLAMAVIALVGVWWVKGTAVDKKAAETVRAAVDPYLVTQPDTTVRENSYFVRTVAGEAVVFDLRLYLSDHGARDIKCEQVYDSASKIYRVTYSFKLGEAEMMLVSYCSTDDGKNLYYRYSDIMAEYPQRIPSIATTQHVAVYTANSEIKHEGNYVVYDKIEPLKFDRATLGQLCYFIQNGYYDYSKIDDQTRTELQAMGFVFVN